MIGLLAILKYLKQMVCFPNTLIGYKILLTIPVIVVSVEWSFLKLKLKSYLRNTMTRERVNGLATIAIENDVIEKMSFQIIQGECCFSVDES